MVHAFALPHIPDMHYAVPTPGNQRVLVDDFQSKYAIVVADGVPACRFEIMGD